MLLDGKKQSYYATRKFQIKWAFKLPWVEGFVAPRGNYPHYEVQGLFFDQKKGKFCWL